ncbi:MAG: hypothetical protein ACKV2Q_18040 [Planctomycetaceae bacterium]
MAKSLRAPKTIDEAKQFLEGMLRRGESFHLSLTLDVNLYGGHITRGEQFDLYWYTESRSIGDARERQQCFKSHSLSLLLQEFVAWRSLRDKPLPPAKANIGGRPLRRLEHKAPVSLWGDDPQ